MQLLTDEDDAALAMLIAAIAHSPIIVAAPAQRLPDGFDDADLAILDWIVAEGRRLGSSALPM
ncbi:MAG TPA: hypothetical protein VK442_01515 [Xanthobacteraceae bacterium]|nr:hypothetical protein [Xanthobacteraceae bacterium]